MTKEEIQNILRNLKIKKATINADLTVDVDGDVDVYITKNNEGTLPLSFSRVNGDFSCSFNELTSLEGAPEYVGKNFYFNNNKISYLKGCPQYVGGGFYCDNNNLTSLQDLPVNFYVGGVFYCCDNNITEAKEFGKLFFGTINGQIHAGSSVLNAFLNQNKNPPKKDLPKLLSELRKIKI